jgi:hypothetical protein
VHVGIHHSCAGTTFFLNIIDRSIAPLIQLSYFCTSPKARNKEKAETLAAARHSNIAQVRFCSNDACAPSFLQLTHLHVVLGPRSPWSSPSADPWRRLRCPSVQPEGRRRRLCVARADGATRSNGAASTHVTGL